MLLSHVYWMWCLCLVSEDCFNPLTAKSYQRTYYLKSPDCWLGKCSWTQKPSILLPANPICWEKWLTLSQSPLFWQF
jgi:hypothetical protein